MELIFISWVVLTEHVDAMLQLLSLFVTILLLLLPSVLWRCWLGGRKGIRPVKNWVVGCCLVICLERGADLHVAQLMPLPLTVSCFSKIQIGLPFWYRLTRVVPEKGPLNGCVCVYHYYYTSRCSVVHPLTCMSLLLIVYSVQSLLKLFPVFDLGCDFLTFLLLTEVLLEFSTVLILLGVWWWMEKRWDRASDLGSVLCVSLVLWHCWLGYLPLFPESFF